ncbi:R-phycoerythrin gamma chain, chloroplastic [Porphyridium purpureum]|uniref:R-phycoerythrin gamma chain, chloroplastic n=1 Tax=Porphyridium purpureum TaxID=35688 RepID=A0A5J4YZH3_PORPP|nr:Chain B8, LR8 [Porphyridium purpureum]6KGX_BA Chain BA, LR8 [Porphyridium purpureum]6KGX_yE Chain yE, LR8 [Porphyridium purpureum]6KGX_yG Chain yG, LR8 [Porphyridium purpureum]7EZX_BB Chain BB, R-phycoerythrin gamma chain, chloroplastic [Porphyridium purpureum]7EZX_BM Chain BM, R-phycoerythrin gamma chain, chloroplastic [Porphyridium purpureum]7EZX_yJ Chain yJ, R-phycoerythrin gamma chain, chloroplastic [Porphyridium purpureum]7EZX_yL Chain yL, R-phycoerythrin gamma chain, chloroplastic [|eukprot:POR8446..scf209_3
METAFVSGFMGKAAVAKFGATAVCDKTARRSSSSNSQVHMVTGAVSSVNMRRFQRVPKVSGFSAKVTKKNVNKALDKADMFFAKSVTMEGKAAAIPYGVYGIQCMEGSAKGMAHEKRAMALSAAFRMNQRSAAEKTGAMYENRRLALILAQNDHQEKQYIKYPKLAAAALMASTEVTRACQRYAVPESIEEEFLAASVDKVNKMRGTTASGVYKSSCVEGNAKGQAEQARVAALAVAFRSAQKSASQFAAERYAQSKYGRDLFSSTHFEEGYANTYPAMAAAKRASSYGY